MCNVEKQVPVKQALLSAVQKWRRCSGKNPRISSLRGIRLIMPADQKNVFRLNTAALI